MFEFQTESTHIIGIVYELLIRGYNVDVGVGRYSIRINRVGVSVSSWRLILW